MDKIYGFKQKDVEKLIDYLGRKNGQPLSRVFEEYAKDSGKSKGTVRNMYYALAKRSREDEAFAARFLGGKPIAVQTVSPFGEDEERRLVEGYRRLSVTGRQSVYALVDSLCRWQQEQTRRLPQSKQTRKSRWSRSRCSRWSWCRRRCKTQERQKPSWLPAYRKEFSFSFFESSNSPVNLSTGFCMSILYHTEFQIASVF